MMACASSNLLRFFVIVYTNLMLRVEGLNLRHKEMNKKPLTIETIHPTLTAILLVYIVVAMPRSLRGASI